MIKELIDKATRNEFREVLVEYTLREIKMIFEAGHLEPMLDYIPSETGERRRLVEQYYANIDFCSLRDVNKLLLSFDELIEQLEQARARVINPDAVDKTINTLTRRMERNGISIKERRFVFSGTKNQLVDATAIVSLNKDSISEHISKAKDKINKEDYSGAITNAYTLVEDFLKEILRKSEVGFNENSGDIRDLFKLVSEPLNLSPKSETLESYLKAILNGLHQQIAGLYEVANKAADRHARKYNPAERHAKLAVNTAFTFCEFLLDSYEYQLTKKSRKAIQ